MVKLEEIVDSVIMGQNKKVIELVKAAISEGLDANTILKEGLIAGMAVVGVRFKNMELFVPEVMLAARAMKSGAEILKPYFDVNKVRKLGTIAVGTVSGDLHDIGKNLVLMMLEGAGFEVIDLGVDVSKEKFIKSVSDRQPDIVGLSALLTTTLPAMKDIIKGLEESGLRGKVKVMIGGAPVTEEFARKIGADGFASDAVSAVDKAKELLAI